MPADLRDSEGRTALFAATSENRRAFVHLLITAKGSVNAADQRSKTPLFEAVEHGLLALVRMLLKNRALVNQARDRARRGGRW